MMALQNIQAAAGRIAPHVHRTPVHTSRLINEIAGRELCFKCENFQRVGAFKFRGAMNAVLQLEDAPTVVTHSSGNHAQALALAASIVGIPATVVMPEDSPAVKVAAVRGYGAEVVFCESTQEARETAAARIVQERGAVFVHPYDDDRIIAGQGTACLELLEEVPDLDAVVAPVGGGGLLSGTAIVADAHGVAVYGAEPALFDDARRSMVAGHVVPSGSPDTIADGLRTSLSERTLAIIAGKVTDMVPVSEEQILSALRLILSRAKLVVEPSAAAALAAALHPSFPDHQRVGIILSGGNIDWPRIGPLLAGA